MSSTDSGNEKKEKQARPISANLRESEKLCNIETDKNFATIPTKDVKRDEVQLEDLVDESLPLEKPIGSFNSWVSC